MPSAIPATKAAILSVLAARPALTGVNITWAAPTKDEDYTETMVFLGDVESTSNWAELGTGRRTEEFTVAVTVFVEQWGDDPQATEERALELWDEIEDALRDDLLAQGGTLRSAGVFKFDGISRAVSTGPSTPEKWGARVDASVDFQARNV